jgi:hypothetical protein
MPYTFRLIFSGLCAFAADRRFDDENNPPTRVTVLLRALEQGLAVGNDQIVPHFAGIEMGASFLRAASTRETQSVGPLARTSFAREDLEIILPPGTAAGLVTNSKKPDDMESPTGDSMKSLFFVPTIDQVNGQPVRVKNALLGQLGHNEPLLVGRVALTAGDLFTHKLQDGTWGLATVGTNVGVGAPQTGGRLAESVALEIGGLTGDVELRFTPFGGGAANSLIVGPPVGNPSLDVVVDLKNREIPEPPPPVLMVPANDRDFRVYFDLADPIAAPESHVIPHLLKAKLSPLDDPRLGGCTPASLLVGGP